MSTRQIERNKQKLLYKKFAEAWRKEKGYQAVVLATGASLPPGVTKLGRKPTFNMWLKMVKTAEARKNATPAEVQDFQDENIDLDWDEDKPEGAGDKSA